MEYNQDETQRGTDDESSSTGLLSTSLPSRRSAPNVVGNENERVKNGNRRGSLSQTRPTEQSHMSFDNFQDMVHHQERLLKLQQILHNNENVERDDSGIYHVNDDHDSIKLLSDSEYAFILDQLQSRTNSTSSYPNLPPTQHSSAINSQILSFILNTNFDDDLARRQAEEEQSNTKPGLKNYRSLDSILPQNTDKPLKGVDQLDLLPEASVIEDTSPVINSSTTNANVNVNTTPSRKNIIVSGSKDDTVLEAKKKKERESNAVKRIFSESATLDTTLSHSSGSSNGSGHDSHVYGSSVDTMTQSSSGSGGASNSSGAKSSSHSEFDSDGSSGGSHHPPQRHFPGSIPLYSPISSLDDMDDSKIPLLKVNSKGNLQSGHSSDDFRRFSCSFWMHQMKTTIKSNHSIFLWCIGAIVSNVMMTVFLKQSANRMPSFPYFILWFTGLLFLLIFWCYYVVIRFFTSQITEETRKVSQKKFVVIGLLTAVNGIFIVFANPSVPGLMQVLLGPTIVSIPLVMLFSLVILSRRFTVPQMVAVCIILVGLFVAIYPSIWGDRHESHGSLAWNGIFLLGSIPVSLATVFEEKAFIEQPIHLSHMLAWSTLYQTIGIALSAPVDLIPRFGHSSSFSELLSNQLDALHCFVGQSVESCPQCECSMSFMFISLYCVGYLASSFFILGVIKYGNATFSILVTAISLTLAEFVFVWPSLMGKFVEKITPFNYLALLILCVGVVLYRIFDSTLHEAKTPSEQAEDSRLMITPSSPSLHVTALPGYQNFQSHLFTAKQPALTVNHEPYYWTFP